MKKYGVLAIIIIAIIIINLLTNSVVLLANSEEDKIQLKFILQEHKIMIMHMKC